jgi:hypothetical protein
MFSSDACVYDQIDHCTKIWSHLADCQADITISSVDLKCLFDFPDDSNLFV